MRYTGGYLEIKVPAPEAAKKEDVQLKAHVYVTLKRGILDPAGKAVLSSLESLGYKGISQVRIGKYMEIDIEGRSKVEAEKDIKDMCETLLVNTTIEDYSFEMDDTKDS